MANSSKDPARSFHAKPFLLQRGSSSSAAKTGSVERGRNTDEKAVELDPDVLVAAELDPDIQK